jgi:hypothetical protein
LEPALAPEQAPEQALVRAPVLERVRAQAQALEPEPVSDQEA